MTAPSPTTAHTAVTPPVPPVAMQGCNECSAWAGEPHKWACLVVTTAEFMAHLDWIAGEQR